MQGFSFGDIAKHCFISADLLLPWFIDVKMAVFQCPEVAWQFQIPTRFPAVKQELIVVKKLKKTAYLDELDAARKPLVVSIS